MGSSSGGVSRTGASVYGLALGIRPQQGALDGFAEVEAGALGAEQAGGLVDDAQQQVPRVAADGREPRADLAQRAFLLGAAREGLAGPPELLDQPRPAERDG